MADRGLRGTRLGTTSLETDVGVRLAARMEAKYDCENGHTVVLPFAENADVPPVWECRCGAEALLRDGERPDPKNTKPQRTHWDMLLERRSIAELEVLLDEQLELLRSGQLR